jgi:inorganic triphosphatase YgiF
MREIELKFLIDERTAGKLWPRVKSLGLAAATPKIKTLTSIYLDTPEHVLKKAGITLRLRRDGRRWIQTVKSSGELHGGLSQVGEFENPAPRGHLNLEAIPDAAVRDEIVRRVNGSPLQPVCEMVIKRRSGELLLDGGMRAELAIDAGEVRAQGRSAMLYEAEIELLEGSPRKLFDIAQSLFPEGGLKFSRFSKAARGFMLAEQGNIEPPLAPRNAKSIALDPEGTTELAARDILRECLEQIALNMEAVCALDDPEGPHQLRIGLRRLRSALSVFAPALTSPEMARLGDEAKWLGQEVGRLRDLDVLADDIVRSEAQAHADEPSLSTLADALGKQAAKLRGHLRKLLVEPRAQALLIDLARFVETRGWLVPEDLGQTERLAAPIAETARDALNKCWKKARKAARDLETLDAGERHELRKKLKKLRYAVEFFAPLSQSKRLEPFLKRLKKLQTVFGDLNDATMVRASLTGAEAPGGDPQSERAKGWVIGATQTRAAFGWAGAKDLWQKLDETRPFWK